MIRSMTGYGRAQAQIDGREITVEIKAVNHRFFEFSSRISRSYGYLEEKVKGEVQKWVSRGKVDAGVTVLSVDTGSTLVEVNRELAGAYVGALRDLAQEFGLEDDLRLSHLAQFSDIFTVRRAPEDEDAVWAAVKTVLDDAIGNFVAMRQREGEQLCSDLQGRLESIAQMVEVVEAQSPQTEAAYRERLTAKIQEVLADRQLDEARIITEAAIFADRIAVAEETVRLRSHIGQFKEILRMDGPVGRKLDFLVQEMNREMNTIGSKAQDVQIAQVVVNMKSELEKIREQIQNIE